MDRAARTHSCTGLTDGAHLSLFLLMVIIFSPVLLSFSELESLCKEVHVKKGLLR